MKCCNYSTCRNPIFSHGYCHNHQFMRTDSKYVDKQKEIKYKRFHPEKKIVKSLDFGFKSESDMFYKIWDERSHICQFTGKDLSNLIYMSDGLWFSCFMHILPKGKYPLFKLNARNIVLGHPEFHHIVDQGTAQDRLDHPTWDFGTWDRLVQKMKEEYLKFQKDNLLA